MERDARWQQQHDLVATMLDHGQWEPVDSWGNGELRLTDTRQWEYAEHILELLERAWDSGYTTGKYDGLYKDFDSYDPEEDDLNPYRKRE